MANRKPAHKIGVKVTNSNVIRKARQLQKKNRQEYLENQKTNKTVKEQLNDLENIVNNGGKLPSGNQSGQQQSVSISVKSYTAKFTGSGNYKNGVLTVYRKDELSAAGLIRKSSSGVPFGFYKTYEIPGESAFGLKVYSGDFSASVSVVLEVASTSYDPGVPTWPYGVYIDRSIQDDYFADITGSPLPSIYHGGTVTYVPTGETVYAGQQSGGLIGAYHDIRYSTGLSYSNGYVFTMPIDGDSFFLVYLARSESAQGGSLFYFETYSNSMGEFPFYSNTGDYFYNFKAYQNDTIINTLTTFEQKEAYQHIKIFRIGFSYVQEVEVPPVFRSVIDRFFRLSNFMFTGAAPYIPSPYDTRLVEYSGQGYPGLPGSLTTDLIAPTSSQLSDEIYFPIGHYGTDYEKLFYQGINDYAFYGSSSLGIYSFLSDSSPFSTYPAYGDPGNPDFYANTPQFPPAAPNGITPEINVDIVPGGERDSTIVVPELGLEYNIVIPDELFTEGEFSWLAGSPVLAWDGGNPGYCKKKLRELGFQV